MKFENSKKKLVLKRLHVFNITESEETFEEREFEEREKKVPEFDETREDEVESKEREELGIESARRWRLPKIETNENYPEQPEVLIKVEYTPQSQQKSELLVIKATLVLNYLPENIKEKISETFYRFLRAPGIKIKIPQNGSEFEKVKRLWQTYIESISLNDDYALSSRIWRKINNSLITAIEKNWRDKNSQLLDIKLFRQGVVLLLYEDAFFLPYYLFTIHPNGKVEKSFETPPPSEILKLEIEKIEIEKHSSTNLLNSSVKPAGLTLEGFLWILARKIGAIIKKPATLTIEQPFEIKKLDPFEKKDMGWKLIQKFLVSNFVEE
jgi:hypothetical protein